MQDLLRTVLDLDEKGDMVKLEEYVATGRYSMTQLFSALQHLLSMAQLPAAYSLAKLIDRSGLEHFIVTFALGAGELACGKEVDENGWLKKLHAQVDAQTSQGRLAVMKPIIFPCIVRLLNIALPSSNHKMIMRVLELLKSVVPVYRTIFDLNAPVPVLSLEEMRQRGREQARLLSNPLPPPGVRQQRRVLLDFQLRMHRATGVRVAAALTNYGWQVETFDFTWTSETVLNNCRSVIDICRQKDIDLLIFDAWVLSRSGPTVINHYREMIAQLRQERPHLKVVGQMTDVYGDTEKTIVVTLSDFCDAICSYLVFPTPVYENPDHGKKVLRGWIPNNLGNISLVNKPLNPEMLFDGTVHASNWPRTFWLSVADHVGLPIRKMLNVFSYDNPEFTRSPVEYFANYMRRLSEATCAISFSDIGAERIVTGRTFETILSGSLLVQESAPNMHAYFIAGEHYLEFSSLAELIGVARFINEHREEAEEVRLCGNAFARERYSDDKLIGHLEKFLYFPD